MSRTIMISSTFRDLEAYRDEVHEGCDRIGFNNQQRMENLGALNANAVEASLEMVEKADIYICFLAHRYGYEPPGSEISITEMEYNRAVELDKPRLVFVIDEDHPFPPSQVDKGDAATKLQAFKDRAGSDRVAEFFTDPKSLRSLVVEALTNLDKTLSDAADEDPTQKAQDSFHRKTTIPAPPNAFVAHPYTLMQTRRLVGRQKELTLLTDWATDPTHSVRIFNLVAIGGMGKSALAWKWFTDVAPNELPDLAGRMWWSFYESDADFGTFMIRALAYLTGEDEKTIRKRPWPEIEADLLVQLSEKPYLLVLDGLERILQAYQRMDAAHLDDDDLLDDETANRVAGAYGLPASAAQSFIGKHRLRQTSDPRAGAFLRKLAMSPAVRVLVTTRLYPTDLQAQTGGPLPGCSATFLRGLTDEDALELWRDLKVKGSSTNLRPIFQSVEGHPLLVQALAAEVANHRAAPGDFAKWREDNPGFDPTSLPLTGARSHILDHALRGLDEAQRQALEHIVAFRMPASYDTLKALLMGEDKPCCDAAALDRVLSTLEDRGLIGWDKVANRYDAHPIVRGVVWSLAGEGSQKAVLTAMDAHFEPMDTPGHLEVESLADLAPAIERYNSLIGLGRFDDAIVLFRFRLSKASLYRLAANRERIEWLQPLFPNGPGSLPELPSKNDQGYVLNTLALSYKASGRPALAAPFFEKQVRISEKEQYSAANLSVVLSNLGSCLIVSGKLRRSDQVLRISLGLSRGMKDLFKIAIRLEHLGRLCSVRGRSEDCRTALARSLVMFGKENRIQSCGVVAAFQAEHALFRGVWPEALKFAQSASEIALHERVAIDTIQSGLHVGQAYLGLGDYPRADDSLHKALTLARSVNSVEFELPALISLAQLALVQDDPDTARAHLEDVWDPAEQGPYPLNEADAFNTLAEIERAEGNTRAAVEAASKAYRSAWCDGPPYAYHWGLEAAKRTLDALGAPYPDMPPFDESKFEPLPDIELFPDDEAPDYEPPE